MAFRGLRRGLGGRLAAHGAECACEFAGEFLTAEKVRLRLKASAEKIEFSASAEDDSRVVVTA